MQASLVLCSCFLVGCTSPKASLSIPVVPNALDFKSLKLARIQLLPDQPSPYLLRDWSKVAADFDALAFDDQAKGPYLPLIWKSDEGFGMPSYVGNETQRGKSGEGICQLGALLGATAIHRDKTAWLEESLMFLNSSEGVVLNNPGGKSGSSFWYDLLPSVVFTQLTARYPTWKKGHAATKSIANAWLIGAQKMGGNFDHTAFFLPTGHPFDNKQWVEPDAAAGVAYIELATGIETGDAKYLKASISALDVLQQRKTNPTYEILTPFGALSAAYLNATKGTKYNTPQFVDWCIEPTAPQRAGWGMVTGKWGGKDTGGLIGSTTDGGGYAFTMNTFVMLGNLAPVARYDSRLSADLAKWILNAANASRYFYSDGLPANNQSTPEWTGDPNHCIAYEGLHKSVGGFAPYATGDAKRGGWAKTDFGMYGSGYVGLLGALIKPSNVPMILRIDLNATDFLPVKAYPTSLYWNPYDADKTIAIDLGNTPSRLFNPVGHRFLSEKPLRGLVQVHLAPKEALQVVMLPTTGALKVTQNMASVNGIPVDFNYRGLFPDRQPVVVPDHSRKVRVGRAKLNPMGVVDWTSSTSDEIVLTGSNGSVSKVSLKFAWDDSFLYFQILQMTPTTEVLEAPNVTEFEKHWWDFEGIALDFDPSRNGISPGNVPSLTVGWSSQQAKNLAFSADLEGAGFSTTTQGSAKEHSRVIHGRIAWSALDTIFGAGSSWRKVGAAIGCQPLMEDGSFKRQAYIGGAQYTRPSGFDENSRTLVLGE